MLVASLGRGHDGSQLAVGQGELRYQLALAGLDEVDATGLVPDVVAVLEMAHQHQRIDGIRHRKHAAAELGPVGILVPPAGLERHPAEAKIGAQGLYLDAGAPEGGPGVEGAAHPGCVAKKPIHGSHPTRL